MHDTSFRRLGLGLGWLVAVGSEALAIAMAGPLASCDQIGCSLGSSPMLPWFGVALGILLGLHAER